MRRIDSLLDDTERFMRGSYLGHTWMLILLGAGTADAAVSGGQIAGLLLIGLNYHVFGYVHNDLLDADVDRTAPLRAQDPLVQGRMSQRAAWTIALSQIPVSFLCATSIGAGTQGLLVLAIGYLATVIYNLYGKRCPVPALTDAVQGVAWSSLALFGTLAIGAPTLLTWLPVGFGFGFIFLINGVHGGLRDLTNDLRHGRLTTAAYFGARSQSDDTTLTTSALQVFAWVAFTLIVAPGLILILLNGLPYTGIVRAVAITGWVLVNAAAALLLFQVVRTHNPDRIRAISQNQLPLLVAPLVLMLPALPIGLQLSLIGSFFLPFVIFMSDVRRFLCRIWLSVTGNAPARRENQ